MVRSWPPTTQTINGSTVWEGVNVDFTVTMEDDTLGICGVFLVGRDVSIVGEYGEVCIGSGCIVTVEDCRFSDVGLELPFVATLRANVVDWRGCVGAGDFGSTLDLRVFSREVDFFRALQVVAGPKGALSASVNLRNHTSSSISVVPAACSYLRSATLCLSKNSNTSIDIVSTITSATTKYNFAFDVIDVSLKVYRDVDAPAES